MTLRLQKDTEGRYKVWILTMEVESGIGADGSTYWNLGAYTTEEKAEQARAAWWSQHRRDLPGPGLPTEDEESEWCTCYGENGCQGGYAVTVDELEVT